MRTLLLWLLIGITWTNGVVLGVVCTARYIPEAEQRGFDRCLEVETRKRLVDEFRRADEAATAGLMDQVD